MFVCIPRSFWSILNTGGIIFSFESKEASLFRDLTFIFKISAEIPPFPLLKKWGGGRICGRKIRAV